MKIILDPTENLEIETPHGNIRVYVDTINVTSLSIEANRVKDDGVVNLDEGKRFRRYFTLFKS